MFTQERTPQQTFTYSKSAIETLKNKWNMFKVNNKDARTTLYSFIVNFEHIDSFSLYSAVELGSHPINL